MRAFYAPEQAVQVQHGAPEIIDLVSVARSGRSTKGRASNKKSSNNDDVCIEEVLGADEAVAKRVKEAESKSEVFSIDD